MAKQPEPSLPAFDEPAKPKTRLVNRNAHLAAASKIVAILETVDPSKWTGILKIVQESLAQPVVDELVTPQALLNGDGK